MVRQVNGVSVDVVVEMVVMAVVGYCGIVIVVVMVHCKGGLLLFRSAIVRCVMCNGGTGICGVVVVVVMMVWN